MLLRDLAYVVLYMCFALVYLNRINILLCNKSGIANIGLPQNINEINSQNNKLLLSVLVLLGFV